MISLIANSQPVLFETFSERVSNKYWYLHPKILLMTPIPIYPKWGDGTPCLSQASSSLATTFKNLVPTILHTTRNGTNTYSTALCKSDRKQFINSARQDISGYNTKLQQLHLYHIHSIHSSKVSTLIFNLQVICFITNE